MNNRHCALFFCAKSLFEIDDICEKYTKQSGKYWNPCQLNKRLRMWYSRINRRINGCAMHEVWKNKGEDRSLCDSFAAYIRICKKQISNKSWEKQEELYEREQTMKKAFVRHAFGICHGSDTGRCLERWHRERAGSRKRQLYAVLLQ